MRTALIKSRLKIIVPLLAEAKSITKAVVDEARILIDEHELKELQDLSLRIGSDNAVIETKLAEFGRMTVGSKRFVVKR